MLRLSAGTQRSAQCLAATRASALSMMRKIWVEEDGGGHLHDKERKSGSFAKDGYFSDSPRALRVLSGDLVSERCSKALSHYPGMKYEQACANTGVHSPSWPWQISVVPMVPSTKTALLVIS